MANNAARMKGYRVTGCKVTGLQGYRGTRLQGNKVTGLQVTRLQGYRVTGCKVTGYRVARLQGCQGYRGTRLQGNRLTEFSKNDSCIEIIIPVHASRFHASRFTLHASLFTTHDSRFTTHDSRLTTHDSKYLGLKLISKVFGCTVKAVYNHLRYSILIISSVMKPCLQKQPPIVLPGLYDM